MFKTSRASGALRTTVAGFVPTAALGFQAGPASAAATSVTLAQTPGVTKAGQDHTVVATVRDEAGNPVPDGTRVTFSVVGTDGTVGSEIAVGPSFWAMAAHGTGGYWLADEVGDVLALGDAPDLGDLSAVDFPGSIVGMAATPSGNGYWLASDAGVVYGFGDAGGVDFRPQILSGDWVAGIAPAATGFWVVTGKGFVLAGGGAITPYPLGWFGRSGGAAAPADQPVVGIVATPSGGGAWLYNGLGRVVNLGDAPFLGDLSALHLNRPVVGMSATPTGNGYYVVGDDGGLFAFGDAPFQGSAGGLDIPADIAGIVTQPDGAGYWIFDIEGRVYPFPGTGTVRGYGSTYTGLTQGGAVGFIFTSFTPGTTTVRVYAGDVAIGSVLGSATQEWSPADGYWMLGADGKVFPFGAAANLGQPDLGGAEAVDLEPTPTFGGYWIVDDTGRVFRYGDAGDFGNADRNVMVPGEKVTSLSATPTGKGYWIFTSRGRVFARGDAASLGDMSATALNGPVLDSVATPTGLGYYMVASDGGIFAFGDAAYRGSMGDQKLNAPVQSLVPDGDGRGYWLVASDGGIFAFDASFRGSMGNSKLNGPVTGMVAFGDGYLMVGTDGGIFNFSSRPFYGSLGATPPARPIVSVAGLDPF